MVYIRSKVLLTPDLREIPQTEINGSTTNKQTLGCAAGLKVSAEDVTRLAKVDNSPVCFGFSADRKLSMKSLLRYGIQPLPGDLSAKN